LFFCHGSVGAVSVAYLSAGLGPGSFMLLADPFKVNPTKLIEIKHERTMAGGR
jgi:hypothetical protein